MNRREMRVYQSVAEIPVLYVELSEYVRHRKLVRQTISLSTRDAMEVTGKIAVAWLVQGRSASEIVAEYGLVK